MVKIDYSKLSYKKTRALNGHSVKHEPFPEYKKYSSATRGNYEENSFYLQKSKETPGRYRPYYEYGTFGDKIPVVGSQEQTLEEEPPLTRVLEK